MPYRRNNCNLAKKPRVEPSDGTVKDFSRGHLIWGKLGSYKWWPAIVINNMDCNKLPPKNGFLWIFWFGDHKISEVSKCKMIDFISNFNKYFVSSGKLYNKAVHEAVKVLATVVNFQSTDYEELILWAKNGFQNLSLGDRNFPLCELPTLIDKYLEVIKSSVNCRSEAVCDVSVVSGFLVENVRRRLKINEICISCRGENIISNHPLFEGGICAPCRERFKEVIFAYGDDGKNLCCIICGWPGTLILCDEVNCPRSYCRTCISVLMGSEAETFIVQTSPWFCFFCSAIDEPHCLQVKEDWEHRLLDLFKPENITTMELPITRYIKRPIRVLSLFDGISTGKYVLEELNLSIEKYFSSETDEDAINVSKLNHGSVVYLGDACSITEEMIRKIGPVDLVLGGSPCKDLSLVNPARKGIYDFTGTGPLFFDFFHILEMAIKNNKENVFFLYENVASMPQRDKVIITSFLKQEPVLIDAKNFSSQTRARYYWGNIPGLQSYWDYVIPQVNSSDSGKNFLNDCLLNSLGRRAMVKKIRTVTTKKNSLIQENTVFPVRMNGEPDILWITELENVFGLPAHYTDTGNLSLAKRRELLGRAWSVPVIKNILKPLTNFFKCKQ